MANQSNFPTSLDAIPTDRTSGDVVPVSDANIYFDATYKLEEKVGVDSSAVSTTIDYKLKNSASLNPGHKHSNAGLSNVPYSVTVETVNATVSTVTTSAHGLGTMPTKVQVSLVCLSADVGWSADDEVFICGNYFDATYARRFAVGADGTNIIIITGANALQVGHKTTGTNTTIDTTKWKIRVRAGI
jgi:hypothetical protein